MRFWISWYQDWDKNGMFELHSPWWRTGSTSDEPPRETICAAVEADDEAAAKYKVLASFDNPPPDLDWRFVEPRADDWSPFSERFRRATWMRWPS